MCPVMMKCNRNCTHAAHAPSFFVNMTQKRMAFAIFRNLYTFSLALGAIKSGWYIIILVRTHTHIYTYVLYICIVCIYKIYIYIYIHIYISYTQVFPNQLLYGCWYCDHRMTGVCGWTTWDLGRLLHRGRGDLPGTWRVAIEMGCLIVFNMAYIYIDIYIYTHVYIYI